MISRMHTVQYVMLAGRIHMVLALISHVRREKVKSNAYLRVSIHLLKVLI